jgi:hypothetical protein
MVPGAQSQAMQSPVRFSPEGTVPLLSIAGTSFECGEQLGMAWRHALRQYAAQGKGRWTPWWWKGPIAKLVQQRAPHLVDVYRGMARGAEIEEETCGYAAISAPATDCTSFGVHKDQTLDGVGLAGQTKDTSIDRTYLYRVLRLRPSDAPGLLTLTYPGELIGYGFAQNGIAIFRNALYVTPRTPGGELPFDAFGLLAHFSPSLDDAVELAKRHGVSSVGHVTLADAAGRSVGLELCQGEAEVIEPHDGLYAHANHTVSEKLRPLEMEADRTTHRAGGSEHRQARLYELMESERGRLGPQKMLQHLSDHANFPRSICSHRGREYHTTAAVVAEPVRGLLHVTRGAPCQNWPEVYRL